MTGLAIMGSDFQKETKLRRTFQDISVKKNKDRGDKNKKIKKKTAMIQDEKTRTDKNNNWLVFHSVYKRNINQQLFVSRL